MKTLSSLVKQLQNTPIKFVGGKGGVGKTTTAAALASQFAEQHQKTLVISTDPAHSLGDVFDMNLKKSSAKNMPVALTESLDALELDPDLIIDEHFARVERTISSYANPDMMQKIREHLQLSKSAPGAQEAAMLEAICRYLVDSVEKGIYQHIIFDTAPTGHTLRLLMLPEMMEAWTDGLLTQQRRQAKLKGAADNFATKKSALTNPFEDAKPVDKWQQAVDVLNARKNLFKRAGELLHDRQKTAVVLVMTADNLPIEETRRAVNQLKEAKLAPAALVVNQLIQAEQSDEFWQNRAVRQQSLLKDIQQHFVDYPIYGVYLQPSDVRGRQALAKLD
ncbi:MAG TPA: arsenic-transporting ATPase [Psychrobacter sp.]|nr:arsenic-transporting ATPase [Psychrobacter sp.]HJH08248.1 ArsA family ATPase [Psychrobacter pasteurii]